MHKKNFQIHFIEAAMEKPRMTSKAARRPLPPPLTQLSLSTSAKVASQVRPRLDRVTLTLLDTLDCAAVLVVVDDTEIKTRGIVAAKPWRRALGKYGWRFTCSDMYSDDVNESSSKYVGYR
jgi:hypothetical protein